MIMLRIQSNIPLGVPNLGTPFKCSAVGAALITAGAGLLGGFLGNSQQAGFTKEQQKLQSRLNREEMSHSMALQKNQQEWLMNRQYGANVSGMKNAGLNPATANGTTPATPSAGSPSSGAAGPAFHGESLANAAAQGASLAADIDLKKSQAANLDAQTDDQRFKNSPVYRQMILRGMDKSIALDVARAAESNSNVNLNVQKVAESITMQQKLLSEAGVNDEQKKVLAQSLVESQYRCASIVQGIKESEQKIVLYKAQAYAQTEIAKLQKHLAHQADTQSSLNTSLGTKADAETQLTKQMRDTEANKTKKTGLEATAQQLANEAVKYANDVLTSMPPEERAKYDIARLIRDYWTPSIPVRF